MAVNQEESLFSGIKPVNGLVKKEFPNNEFENSMDIDWETGNSHNYREVKAEKLSEDILDLLPNDPFDMDISATVTAISGWIEEFGLKNLGLESGEDEHEDEDVDDQLLAELNIVWNSTTGIHADVSNMKSDTRSIEPPMVFNSGSPLLSDGAIEDVMGFSFEKYWTPPDLAKKHQGCTTNNDGIPGPPPDALFLALGCLGVRDLLSVERVCKSLRDAVKSDPLLWRNIHIEYPSSHKITDDDLIRLTNRAQGTLHSLSVAGCTNITHNGLKWVLESNLGLTKLSVAGCLKICIEGIMGNLKIFKSVGRPGIKSLRIGGIFGVTNQHFQELKLFLGAQNQKQQHRAQKPRFFRAEQLYLSFDDDRDIDIETCPRCQQVREVYDCPADSCRGKLQVPQECRACTLCISRCINCGCCLNNRDYEETFCLELICLDCCKQLLNCQDEQKRMAILPKQTRLNQQASCRFFLYG